MYLLQIYHFMHMNISGYEIEILFLQLTKYQKTQSRNLVQCLIICNLTAQPQVLGMHSARVRLLLRPVHAVRRRACSRIVQPRHEPGHCHSPGRLGLLTRLHRDLRWVVHNEKTFGLPNYPENHTCVHVM